MFSNNFARFLFVLYIVLLTVVTLSSTYKTQNYCAKDICSTADKKHIGCDATRQFLSTCSEPRLVPMSTKRKNLILMMHNRLRNKVASGGLKKYKKASNMSVMIWDDELAYLAELNVRQCEMKHDECRSTARFKYAGQNLARRWLNQRLPHYNDNIKTSIMGWFNEHKDASMQYIRSYSKPKTNKMIGHFTALIRDESTHVGCAISTYNKSYVVKGQHYDGKEFLLGCNYAHNNILNKPIYIEGRPCSKCPNGVKCHRTYTALCDVNSSV
uniref:Putative salivary ag5 protein n=1 Tax=Psorophora albipes TaxID=869069 RepID=T1E2V6_9DIPT